MAADEAGAQRTGYLTSQVDMDFAKLAWSYEKARDDMLLKDLKPEDVLTAMDMARIVWKSAREQFKYALAMNDIVTKAYLQVKESHNEDDQKAFQILQQTNPKITFNASGDTEFDLTPEEFWRLFTGPSF